MPKKRDITPDLAKQIGPALFRMVWWAHLDPSRRASFVDDLFEAISESLVRVFEEDSERTASDAERDFATFIIRALVEEYLGKLEDIVPPFSDETFEKVIRNILAEKEKSKINNLLAQQYEGFLSRTADLSESLISAVRLINEEFVIWLKAHPQHTEQIHSDAFEQLSGEVLASQGFAVEFTGRVKNLSADLIAVKKDENNEEIKYLIECKRYGAGKKVDLHIVNAVIGASYRARVKHAMLLTTSSFTSNSTQVLTDLADIRLELHDGATITEWLASYRFKRFGLWLPPGWQDVWTPKA